MMKFIKDGDVKIVDDVSSLIPVLLLDGWVVEGDKQASDDVSALRAEAEALGLKIHHKAGAEKIKELIEEAKANVNSTGDN